MPKKPLDANKPRGPVTAYALFVRTCRDELRRKYPQLAVDYNVIAKKCSERWKVMSDNEKKRFNDTADSQRKRYKEEMATYLQEQAVKQQQQQSATSSILLQTPSTQYLVEPQQHTLLIPTQTQQTTATTIVTVPKKPAKKRERKPKDPHAPKKPLSAYFLFCADERPKVHGSQTGMSVSDVARELGIRWKNAPVELKNKYEVAASEKKNVYQAEMAIYKHQTSTNSSPPETPQTPLTPHDFQPLYSSSSMQQQHSQLQHILQQQHQQNFNSYDNSDTSQHPTEFDMITGGHAVSENDV
ncbi:unnamed protein product [Rotaria socialis]|uniref:HMG box domain-containing protein n=1 Tax=Rotaria socialis TaxID=392032 RepID=A0A818LZZ2_9BILA|nr:unnamed protein product [Rotaria socialis]CAF3334855.1 unnamed protein product [Rotaria socialis]CAF3399364.1 unnamed protein product [Rotaria socialis]CAF3559280.1 unnamed protein product [Rotaria socialis]CAF3586092.1 unnamed protein product [Rotaria socialis]